MRQLRNLIRTVFSVFTNHFADFLVSEAGARSQTPQGIDSAALEKGRIICACAVNTIRAGYMKETREFIQRQMLQIASYWTGGNNYHVYGSHKGRLHFLPTVHYYLQHIFSLFYYFIFSSCRRDPVHNLFQQSYPQHCTFCLPHLTNVIHLNSSLVRPARPELDKGDKGNIQNVQCWVSSWTGLRTPALDHLSRPGVSYLICKGPGCGKRFLF